MYHCGPTVYDYAHIGNLRAYVFADVLRRAFEYEGFAVTQIINITDVGHLVSDADEGEDKIEAGARREHKTAQQIADYYTEAFMKDLAALHVRTLGTQFPRATTHIEEQIALVETLEKKGFTYKTSDGIYFDTSKFPTYANFAKLDVKGMQEGARVLKNPEKRNSTDFALWKFSPTGTKREQEWDSPWGIGFPGWHLECSAMSMKYLGEQFDIHTGGVDHIPVHHTNEIAQSECATGKHPFVNVWMHSGFLTIDDAKMAKSAGNFTTLTDLMTKGYAPEDFRYFLLGADYKKQINFTWEALSAARNARLRLVGTMLEYPDGGSVNVGYNTAFRSAIENDLDTPTVLALVWKLNGDESVSPADKKATILAFDEVLGLGLSDVKPTEIPPRVRALAEERMKAREANNFTRADEIRDEIESLGFEIRDTETGPKITKAN